MTTRITRSLLTLLAVILFTACGNKTIYDEERTVERGIWNRFTPEVFDIPVNDIKSYYDIDIIVTVDTNIYRYEQVPLMLTLDSPNGEQRQFYGTVLLKDKGRWRGEMQDKDGSTLRDVSGRIRSYFSFNTKGTHRLGVSHTTSQYDLEGLRSLRLHIEKAKVDYNL